MNSEIKNLDDFYFLFVLREKLSMSKSELVNKNFVGKTTGTDIIKRLQKKELINERSIAEDKRRKLISISEKGEK